MLREAAVAGGKVIMMMRGESKHKPQSRQTKNENRSRGWGIIDGIACGSDEILAVMDRCACDGCVW